MASFEPDWAPPLYADLDSANTEIRRLQRVVFLERQQLVARRMEMELTKRSFQGTIKKLEEQLREKTDEALKCDFCGVSISAYCESCGGYNA